MANIDNLFKIMAEKRVSQKELAVAINASTGNVSDWKKGRSFPSAQKLDEAATFLECSVDYLLGRTDIPNGENVNNISGNSNNGDNSISIGTKSAEALSEPTDTMTRKFFDVFVHLDFAQQVNVMKYALEQAEKSA